MNDINHSIIEECKSSNQTMINNRYHRYKNKYHLSYCPREFHAQSIGFANAEFKVLDNIPEEYRIGIFSHLGKTFNAHIRFSFTLNPPLQPDPKRDTRGVALKVYDVAPNQHQAFTLINYPIFALSDITMTNKFLAFGAKLTFSALLMLIVKVNLKLVRFLRILPKLTHENNKISLLNTTFYSTTPFALGEHIQVKYKLKPVTQSGTENPPKEPCLHKELITDLNKQSASYEFMIQIRKDNMPIDDASALWSEEESPFIPVAIVEIPKQDITSLTNKDIEEKLTFAVNETLPEHKPLGSMNELRVAVMKQSIEFRYDKNKW